MDRRFCPLNQKKALSCLKFSLCIPKTLSLSVGLRKSSLNHYMQASPGSNSSLELSTASVICLNHSPPQLRILVSEGALVILCTEVAYNPWPTMVHKPFIKLIHNGPQRYCKQLQYLAVIFPNDIYERGERERLI